MTNTDLAVQFTIRQRFNRPPTDVFAAFTQPEQINQYFTSAVSQTPVAGGTTVWEWAGGDRAELHFDSIDPPAALSFHWEAHKVGYETQVEIEFAPHEINGTMVTLRETGWQADQAGVDSSHSHCAGWQEMLVLLKAWLEHRIELRK